MRPTVKTKCPAAAFAGPDERIVEIWDSGTQKGCLISIRAVRGDLIIEAYRGDPGVIVRVNGEDARVSA